MNEQLKTKYKKNRIEVWLGQSLIGYLSYSNHLNRYWAPIIYLNIIEVINHEHRDLGVGSILMEELINLFPNEIITLNMGDETNYNKLEHFYNKFGFYEIPDLDLDPVFIRTPGGKSISDFKPVPSNILYRAMHGSTKYDLVIWVLDDYYDLYYEDFYKIRGKGWAGFYEAIKEGTLMELLLLG